MNQKANPILFVGASFTLAISVLLLANGCSVTLNATHVQGADNWVVLEVENARSEEGRLVWDFQLNHPWRYYVQVIHPGTAKESVALIDVAGQQFSEPLKKSFVIDAGIVSQFKTLVIFKRDGRHTLSIKTDVPLKQIRLIPQHKSLLGSGRYYEQWRAMHESSEKQATMKWFKEARFGMFIHWGLYSQAGGMWKGTRIEKSPYPGPGVAEWLMFKFRIPRDEYAKLARTFKPDRSFAQNIARLAKDAGMRYLVITSKHHDGFALFDSNCSAFDMVDATAYQADAIKELYDACQEEGVAFGIYYSHGHDWSDGTDGNYATVKKHNDILGIPTRYQGKNLWDPSPNSFAEYLESKAYPQIAELLHLMPKLRLIWFDGEGLITEEQAFRFYKLIYDINPSVIVNRRIGYGFGDYLDAGDNVIPSTDESLSKHWETCGTTNNSWGYKAYDQDWKSTRELLYYLIDIASKGGNYLLNIGPDGKGRVPEACANNMRQMGEWVRINADAVYGTTRWKITHEGQGETLLEGTGHRAAKGFSRKFTTEDFWFTARGNKVYAISLVPAGDIVRIRSLNKSAGRIKQVRLLGNDRILSWKQTETALEIDFAGMKTGENGFAIEAVLE